jgi:TolA-binding protein
MCSGVLPQQPPAILISPRAQIRQIPRHVIRPKIEPRRRQRIRQSRIRIARHRNIRLLRKLAQKRIHQVRPQRAVQSHENGAHAPPHSRRPQRSALKSSSRRRAPPPPKSSPAVPSCWHSAHPHRTPPNRHQRRLGIQRIEDRLHQQQIRAARNQRPHLLLVRRLHLVERHHAKPRIVGIRRIRKRHRQRPQSPQPQTSAAPSRSPRDPPTPAPAAPTAR